MNTVLDWITWEFNYFFLSYGNSSSIKSDKVNNVTGELYRTKVFTVCSKITWNGWLLHSAAKEFRGRWHLSALERVCRGVGQGGSGKHECQKWFAWPYTFPCSFRKCLLSSPTTCSLFLAVKLSSLWLSFGIGGFRVFLVPQFCKQAVQKLAERKE